VNGYTCTCVPGYTGAVCQQGNQPYGLSYRARVINSEIHICTCI